MTHVCLLGTFETKQSELAALTDFLEDLDLEVVPVDLSLGASGEILPGESKIHRMEQVGQKASLTLEKGGFSAAIALGGGTGSEIALNAMRSLTIPKFLITTLPFDPRHALADNGTVLIPTLCDVQGMNSTLRQIFERSARMVKASIKPTQSYEQVLSVGISLLGVTQKACDEILPRLTACGIEPFAFHANGFGGAAFTRFAKEGMLHGVIDLTLNDIVRQLVGGPHVEMPDRYSGMSHLPRVVLPGAISFFDAGPYDQMSPEQLERPHYRHSGYFTHVKLLPEDMRCVGEALAADLNLSQRPCVVILPMGGFSSEDRPGGAIEDLSLREQLADILEGAAKAYAVERVPHHINDAETAEIAVAHLHEIL